MTGADHPVTDIRDIAGNFCEYRTAQNSDSGENIKIAPGGHHTSCRPDTRGRISRHLSNIRYPGQVTLVARAEVRINASTRRVWDALVNPEIIRLYMFGTHAVSDWKEGSPITWEGEWEGKHYEDKGVILRLEPERYSNTATSVLFPGFPDSPENYHTVTIRLSSEGEYTRISLSQDNNPTEQARDHSQKNWEMVLAGLKKVLESDVLQRTVCRVREGICRA